MINYSIQEGKFSVPGDGWQDASMNIFKNPVTQASLIISRGKVREDDTLEEEMKRQWDILRPSIQHLAYDVLPCPVLPDSPDCEVQETLSTFVRSGVKHHQHQLAVHPYRSTTLLVFTYTSMQKFSAEDNQVWLQIKNSIQIN